MLRDSLAGIKVLDFSHVVAGPVCGMLLGDLGADVIKIEPPGGELGRAIGPPWIEDQSVVCLSVNRNKRGLALDLRDSAAREAVLKLVLQADVLIESFRPGVMDRLGLGHDAVAAVNPRIVYCSISAYGQSGPCSGKPGVDGIIQAVTGLMSTLGEADAPPSKVSVPIADMATGYLATIAILSALRCTVLTGEGQHIDISLYNATLMLQQVSLTSYLASGDEPRKTGSAAPYAAPNEAFPTEDGWIMVAAYQPERWRRLCGLLGLEDLLQDPRFSTNTNRVGHRAQFNDILGEVFKTSSTAEWLRVLEEADIICAPIATYGELTGSLQYLHSGIETSFEHPVAGTVRLPGFAISDPHASAAPDRAPPLVGQHSAEVLAEYGLSPEEIASLTSRGAVIQTSINEKSAP